MSAYRPSTKQETDRQTDRQTDGYLTRKRRTVCLSVRFLLCKRPICRKIGLLFPVPTKSIISHFKTSCLFSSFLDCWYIVTSVIYCCSRNQRTIYPLANKLTNQPTNQPTNKPDNRLISQPGDRGI